MEAAVWTVSASRMKARREHRVPLSNAALAVLHAMLPPGQVRREDYIFPGQRSGKPLSSMAMLMLLRRMKRGDLTAHGFRSSFRDWCEEATSAPHAVSEAALAHTISDKVEAAYRRGDLFTKRRTLMQDWANFCAGQEGAMHGRAEPAA
jgi:integrase